MFCSSPRSLAYLGEYSMYLEQFTLIVSETAFNYCISLDREERKLICEELAASPLSLRSLSY
jgi:hypothetical protein